MPAAVETSFEPDAHDRQGQVLRDQALTYGKDVSIVVLAREAGRLFIPAKCAAHAVHLVRHHRFAIAGTTEHDAPFALAASYRFRCGPNEKRIVDRFFTERAEVFYFVSEGAEQFFYLFLVEKAGVV